MIEIIEEKLREMEIVIENNDSGKHKKIIKKDYMRLSKELDKIYAMYGKILRHEEKICKKFNIEAPAYF